MWGMIAKLTAHEGRRQELIATLEEGTRNMPGCRSYVIAEDASDDHAVWVSEVWDSRERRLPVASECPRDGQPREAPGCGLRANCDYNAHRGHGAERPNRLAMPAAAPNAADDE